MSDFTPITTAGPSGPRASFGSRLVAFVLDGIIVGIVNLILTRLSRPLGEVGGTLVSLAYFTYFFGSPSGQTIGMRALGIRVYDFTRGGPIGYGRGFARWLGYIVSGIPCFLGFFWALWDKEKQTWADKIATTVVVPVSAYPVQP